MSKSWREQIHDRTSGHCAYCGIPLLYHETWHVDHILPRSKGGAGGDNLIPACPRCNLRKGCSTPEEFRTRLTVHAHKELAALLPELAELCEFLPSPEAAHIMEHLSSLLTCLSGAAVTFFIDEPRGKGNALDKD